MENLIDFIFLRDYSIRIVVLGAMLICAITAMIGCFAFLQKRSLVGDSVSHAVLPGVCLAFIFFNTKNPWILLGGAFTTGWLSIIVLNFITRNSRIKNDAAIAITLSVFFAIGIMLLTMIQHSGNAAQAGLDHFLFGKAAAIGIDDVRMFVIASIILVAIVVINFQKFKIFIFDQDYAKSIGLNTKGLDLLLSTLIVAAIAIGIRTVGVVLIAALLITPAAAARYWTSNLTKMIVLATIFGMLAGWTGAFISYVAPAMPTGPWIIVSITLVAIFSLIFGKEKGLWLRHKKQRQFSEKINLENALKIFYHLGEEKEDYLKTRSLEDLIKRRPLDRRVLQKSLNKLERKGILLGDGKGWKLSEKGLEESKKVIRLHRLWELYLTQHLSIAEDHVHDDAEAIEHILTPEIQAQLEILLDHPETDPHSKPIPL